MRKSTLLKAVAMAALAAGGCLTAQADTDLEVLAPDGTKQAFSLASTQRIEFVEGSISVLTDDGAVQIPYAELQNIQFTISSSLTSITDEAAGLRVAYADGALCITRINQNGPLSVALYNTAGQLVLREAELTGDRVDVRHLQAGVYLAKINNTIIKFIKN